MTKRKMLMLAELLETVRTFLREVQAEELNPSLLTKAQQLHPIVEGFEELVRAEAAQTQ